MLIGPPRRVELRQDLVGVRVEERLLRARHVVDEQVVDAALEEVVEECQMTPQIGRAQHRVGDRSRPNVLRGDLELLDGDEVGHERGVEHVGAPLLERARDRVAVGLAVRDLRLHGNRLVLAAPFPERLDERAQLIRWVSAR